MKRNRLFPWIVTTVIVFAAVLFVGYRMAASNCAPLAIDHRRTGDHSDYLPDADISGFREPGVIPLRNAC